MGVLREASVVLDAQAEGRLAAIAASLSEISSSGAISDPGVAATLAEHGAYLRDLLKTVAVDAIAGQRSPKVAGIDEAIIVVPVPAGEAADPSAAISESERPRQSIYQRRKTTKRIPQLTHRDSAASLILATGSCGEMVDDLQEISIDDIDNKHALAYWRMCSGLRLYRSATVTKALRLICSEPVPGLNGPSYLDVFKRLTESAWAHHIFLFGGLVRDILRRKVGNDIDIAFTAPACELEQICQKLGYKCQLDGDYILIGEEGGEEYLEGMVITHNGIQPAYHADFSMNWLFYDFVNDVIVDKMGVSVDAVIANKCDMPCPVHEWSKWFEINGSRVFFRYFKFLLRGYTYEEASMAYVATHLLEAWSADEQETINIGRMALGNLVGSQKADQIEHLRQLVFKSFDLAQEARVNSKINLRRRQTCALDGDMSQNSFKSETAGAEFFSASAWWQRGWIPLLQITP